MNQNTPNPFNPFNPFTTIRYSIPYPTQITLNITNIRGQRIKTLVDRYHQSGNYRAVWDGIDDRGKAVDSGIYFYQITTQENSETRKMLLLR